MGKQRTPQGRSTGRRPPVKAPAALPAVAPEAALHPAEDALPAVLPGTAPEPLHAHLLDTVSPEAIGIVAPGGEPRLPPVAMPVPADANLATPATDLGGDLTAARPTEPETPSLGSETPSLESERPSREPEVARAAPEPEASPAYSNVVPLKSPGSSRPPEPAVAAEAAEAPVRLSDGALPAPASWRAGRRPVPSLRQDLEGLGETLFAFMRDEGSAVLTHLNALKDARSPADAIRLQVNEMQRVADASLTCWSELARRATRIVAQR